jgi:hypothetical protein
MDFKIEYLKGKLKTAIRIYLSVLAILSKRANIFKLLSYLVDRIYLLYYSYHNLKTYRHPLF